MSKDLDLSFQKIHRLYKKQAAVTMGEMNSSGMLYSSFTIDARIKNTIHFLREELEKLAPYHNSPLSSRKMMKYIDKIEKEERSALNTFCEQMPSIKIQDQDFIQFQELKNDIKQFIRKERYKSSINIITLVVAILTLIATIATPIIIENIKSTDTEESNNE